MSIWVLDFFKPDIYKMIRRRIFVWLFLTLLFNLPDKLFADQQGFKILSVSDKAVCYGIWELDFEHQELNKFNPESKILAQITDPYGNEKKIESFWYMPWSGTNNKGFWKIRYCPEFTGEYQVKLFYTEKKKSQFLKELKFITSGSKSKGFLKLNYDNKNYLRFSNGEGYFALGLNICWPDSRNKLKDYLRYLDILQKNNCNYTRLWLCTWGFNLETEKPYAYNMTSALYLDRVFEEAAKRGIYIKLCLLNFHDFVYSPDKGPYLSKWGPCRDPKDFFLKKEARKIFKNLLHYTNARWGAYTSLYGWELWNEKFYALENTTSKITEDYIKNILFLPWTREMALELKKIDPYNHIITTSLGMNINWPEIWNIPEIDVVQYHTYINYDETRRMEAEKDIPFFLLERKTYINYFEKPYLMSEFGYAGTNEYNPYNDIDKNGIGLHNSLWASSFSGYSGCAMNWWWDNYIDKNNLYYHYKALADFLAGIDWNRKKIYFADDSDPVLRVMGMKDDNITCFWMQNKRASWFNIIECKNKPQTLKEYSFELAGYEKGSYQLEWYDTHKGNIFETQVLENDTGKLTIKLPEFKYDVALRLFLQKN